MSKKDATDREARMAAEDHRRGDSGAPRRDIKRTSMDASFDRWLIGQMRQLYDQVLEERVPDDLVDLVRSFEPDTAGQGDSATEGRDEGQSERRPAGRSARR